MNSTKLKLIQLTEVLQSNGETGFDERDVLVNAEAIVTVQTFKLEKQGQDRLLIGGQRERDVSQITTVVGSRVHVTQTLDEVTAAIKNAVETV